MSDITPSDIAVAFWRWLWVAAGALAVLAALIWGGWQAGWWFSNASTGREAHQIRNGYSNQQTLRDQITAKIADVDTVSSQIAASKDANFTAFLKAQRMGIAAIVCADAAQVTGDPLQAQQAQWVAVNCSAGAVSPDSPLYQAGTP